VWNPKYAPASVPTAANMALPTVARSPETLSRIRLIRNAVTMAATPMTTTQTRFRE